jgi:hypothetical protein
MQGFLLDSMCASKAAFFASHRPLLDYRNEELSQMLLDSFHPVRSNRYHSRREAFIRKYKSTATPARYARALADGADEEDGPEFDDAPGWQRGTEWAFAGLPTPTSIATSADTRVNLYSYPRKGSVSTVSDAHPETPPSDTLPQGRFQSGSPSINELYKPKMGMQGFDINLQGLGLGKGDVQFPCLYQPEPERL